MPDVESMRNALSTALGQEWDAWTCNIGVRFTVSLPNGTDLSVEQFHGGESTLTVTWLAPTTFGDCTVYTFAEWGDLVAEVADMGSSLL